MGAFCGRLFVSVMVVLVCVDVDMCFYSIWMLFSFQVWTGFACVSLLRSSGELRERSCYVQSCALWVEFVPFVGVRVAVWDPVCSILELWFWLLGLVIDCFRGPLVKSFWV